MGTLATALGEHAERVSGRPRVYVDANMPAGLVTFMRSRLQWDVLFVMEHDDLRRARDEAHYCMARKLRRTLRTLDRDYLDDHRFPPSEDGGVVVLAAPRESGFRHLLGQIDRRLFRASGTAEGIEPLPRAQQKLHVHVDWTGER
jgi:hypothetical protein